MPRQNPDNPDVCAWAIAVFGMLVTLPVALLFILEDSEVRSDFWQFVKDKVVAPPARWLCS